MKFDVENYGGENLVALIGPGYHTPNTPSRPHEIDIFPASFAQMDIRFPANGPPDKLVIRAPDGSEKLITHTAFYEPLAEGTRFEYQRGVAELGPGGRRKPVKE